MRNLFLLDPLKISPYGLAPGNGGRYDIVDSFSKVSGVGADARYFFLEWIYFFLAMITWAFGKY